MRILLLSDVSINVDAGGLSQTLYNIFCSMQPENMLCVTSSKAFKKTPPSKLFISRYIHYKFEILHIPRNRLAKYISKTINWINYTYNSVFRDFKKLRFAIKTFDPDIVIACPNGPEGLFMLNRLSTVFENKKVYPYFMDDWLYHSHLKWAGSNIQDLAKKILSKHTSWMMISANLSGILGDRYKTVPSKLLEIHNPVDITGINDVLQLHNRKTVTIAYAGGLWPMHFDAFLVIARAIQLLKKHINISLLLYTSESNWNWRKHELEKLDVIYGGHVPYNQVHSKLAEADCLLVTSSFSDEWRTHSKGSVQTKITDYLKARRLIIACGPTYAANNDFIKKHDCGICIETNNEQQAACELDKILNHIQHNQRYVINGLQLLKEHLSFEKVHQELNKFLLAELL